ncbi:uncharacterized protein TNCV_2920041 [Trichonephila clavipes]|nr:uncharacterized protein TNCV_2920041 [Trichonephila clavipes]
MEQKPQITVAWFLVIDVQQQSEKASGSHTIASYVTTRVHSDAAEQQHPARRNSDIVNCIKIQQIKWAGYVVRMDEDPTTKKVFNAQPIGTRRKGRPNLSWIDGLEKYLLVLRTKRTLAGRRMAWKKIPEKAKAHPGLSSH